MYICRTVTILWLPLWIRKKNMDLFCFLGESVFVSFMHGPEETIPMLVLIPSPCDKTFSFFCLGC